MGSGQPYCQNGKSECWVNLLHMCAKANNPHFTEYVPFAVCVNNNFDTIYANNDHLETVISGVVANCTAGTQIDAGQVLDCWNTDVFHSVMKDTALQTMQHAYTPWVVLTNNSGIPMVVTDVSTPRSLLQAVCNAWKLNGGGSASVKVCSDADSSLIAMV